MRHSSILGGLIAGIVQVKKALVRAAHIQNIRIDCGMRVNRRGIVGAIAELEQCQQRDQATIHAS